MTTIWEPDSCDCIIEMDTSENYVGWIQKCDLHKALNDQAWVDAVKTHNKTFQMTEGDQAVKSRRNTNTADKRAEKASIKATGPTEKNPRARKVRIGN